MPPLILLVMAVLTASAPYSPAAAQSGEPGRTFRDCRDCPWMVVIPAGRATIGPATYIGEGNYRSVEDGPTPEVVIARPFAIARTEVTRRQFRAFMEATGHTIPPGCEKGGQDMGPAFSWQDPGYPQEDDHPVVCVSHADAQAYAAWLSGVTGERYRLPSDAEWEYVARAGATDWRPWGRLWDDGDGQCASVNAGDRSTLMAFPTWSVVTEGFDPVVQDFQWAVADCTDGHVFTAPAGSFPANPFGVHDMLGNAWEWVADCWNERHADGPLDGAPRLEGFCAERILRGGSWVDPPWDVRLPVRTFMAASSRSDGDGFRVAREIEP